MSAVSNHAFVPVAGLGHLESGEPGSRTESPVQASVLSLHSLAPAHIAHLGLLPLALHSAALPLGLDPQLSMPALALLMM